MLSIKRPVQTSAEAWDLYARAFPHQERRCRSEHVAAVAQEKDFYAMELYRDGVFVCLLFYWVLKGSNILFLEHLAVQESCRGMGVGEAALRMLPEGYTVLAEIEPVEDEMTARRWRFYEHAGFVLQPQAHVQLPFHDGDAPVPLLLISRREDGQPATQEQVDALEQALRDWIMLRRAS